MTTAEALGLLAFLRGTSNAGGGGGVTTHNALTSASRALADQHPIPAITGLTDVVRSVYNNGFTYVYDNATAGTKYALKIPPAMGKIYIMANAVVDVLAVKQDDTNITLLSDVPANTVTAVTISENYKMFGFRYKGTTGETLAVDIYGERIKSLLDGAAAARTAVQPSALTSYQTQSITDTGGYYGNNPTVDGALQKIGAAMSGLLSRINSL